MRILTSLGVPESPTRVHPPTRPPVRIAVVQHRWRGSREATENELAEGIAAAAGQGARLVQAVRPAVTVPVHFDDYGVFRSPRADFERRFARDGLPGDLRLVERGQTVSLVP